MNIKEARKRLGLKQSDMAKELNLSERQYRRIEQGRSLPDIMTAIHISDVLQVQNPRTLWGCNPAAN